MYTSRGTKGKRPTNVVGLVAWVYSLMIEIFVLRTRCGFDYSVMSGLNDSAAK